VTVYNTLKLCIHFSLRHSYYLQPFISSLLASLRSIFTFTLLHVSFNGRCDLLTAMNIWFTFLHLSIDIYVKIKRVRKLEQPWKLQISLTHLSEPKALINYKQRMWPNRQCWRIIFHRTLPLSQTHRFSDKTLSTSVFPTR